MKIKQIMETREGTQVGCWRGQRGSRESASPSQLSPPVTPVNTNVLIVFITWPDNFTLSLWECVYVCVCVCVVGVAG